MSRVNPARVRINRVQQVSYVSVIQRRPYIHTLESFGGLTVQNEMRAWVFAACYNAALEWIKDHPHNEESGFAFIATFGNILGTKNTTELLGRWGAK